MTAWAGLAGQQPVCALLVCAQFSWRGQAMLGFFLIVWLVKKLVGLPVALFVGRRGTKAIALVLFLLRS